LSTDEIRLVCNTASEPPLSMATKTKSRAKHSVTNQPPKRFQQFGRKYPAVMRAYEALGAATAEAGPLDAKTRALAKLAIATGAWREGAVHSHTHRALAAGCTPDEIRHVVLLATTTLGFPSMMAVRTWVEDVLGRK
jgi:4-carboxymuconolactone decarboxylase